MPSELPTGTVTFLFTDVEGSTRLWEQHPAAMAEAIARQEALLRDTIRKAGGWVFKTAGDSVSAAFDTAPDAVAAALAAQQALRRSQWLETGPIRVRMALHTGIAEERDADYFGATVNRAGRLMNTGHGGQILLSLACEELVRDHLPAGASLLDLGEHRLRDLARPEHIFQLVHPDLEEDFPALRSLDAHPNNLPVQRTQLVGRHSEVASIRALLGRPDVGLVTLTGPGGTGKTRLALQVGAEIGHRYPDGVFFVALAPILDPQLVPSAIARTLGLREEGEAVPLDALREHLKTKTLLLILDNFEQIVDAAPVVSSLLGSCPKLNVLVTSRAVLRVHGEQEFAVPPLALPNLRHVQQGAPLSHYPAVELFTQRALAVHPEFAITPENGPSIAEICAKLDGLPLAIELAAARVKLLPPEAMLGRLDNRLKLLTRGARDLPSRQQTLRGAIGWGYDLLSEGERALYRRLSVFSGGFTYAAAEAVCDPEAELDVDLLDGLESLVDKSFLKHDQADSVSRFTMLETIREFGVEALQAEGEAAEICRRHAHYFAKLAEEAELALRGPQQHEWLDRLEKEHDNVRSALRWADRMDEESETAWCLAGSLWRFWFLRGYLAEGRRRLERLIEGGRAGSVRARARAVTGAAFLAFFQGDMEASSRNFQQSMRLSDEAGDMWHLAFSFCGIGITAQFMGDHERARTALDRGMKLARRVADPWLIALASAAHWGTVVYFSDYAAAEEMYAECLEMCRESGDHSIISWPLMILGSIKLMLGQPDVAGRYFREALGFAREMMNKQAIAGSLDGIAEVYIAHGQLEEGARLYGTVDALRESTGCPRQPYDIPMYEIAYAELREKLGQTRIDELREHGRAVPLETAMAQALGDVA